MRTLEPDRPTLEPAEGVPGGADTGRRARATSPRWRRAPSGPLGHVPVLDGLRGLAMVVVVLSHLWVVTGTDFVDRLGPAASGVFHAGGLGVTVFLVLGGFLITNALLTERDATGGTRIGAFWRRRLWRIVPPVAVVLAVFCVLWWAESFAGSSPRATFDSVASSLTFTYNWLLVDRPVLGRPELGHLWYLSVEQQFYVGWVLLVALLGRHRRALGILAAAAAVAVVVWRVIVWHEAGWWPASLRTDTRIDGLLLGGVLAVARSTGRLRLPRHSAVVGAVAMAVLVVAARDDDYAQLGTIGVLFVLATALAIGGVLTEPGALRPLGTRPLRALGAISFAAYLWHLPIFYFVGHHGSTWPAAVRLGVAAGALTVVVPLTRRFVERPAARRAARLPTPPISPRRRFTRAAALGGLVGAVPFLMVLWDFGIRPLRTASATRIFSNFYDVQARALMAGDLSVPTGSLSIEAFRVGGRDYMYFPPLPAILRIPALAMTDALDGRLSAPSMVVAWVLLVVFTAALVWRVRCILRPGEPLGRLEAFASGTLVAVVGGGSIVTFLAALPWVYHEAYLWALAMAIGTIWAIVGVLERPSVGRVLGASGLALGTILSRTTSGWALCLTLVAAGVAVAVVPRWRAQRRWSAPIVLAGVVPLVIGAAVNWAKFRHPFMFPLQDQVWTALNPQRRRALARNGGGLTGPQFFPTAVVNYLGPFGIRFSPTFPFITLPSHAARTVGNAFLDQRYRTGSAVAFMPLLTVLGVAGLAATFRRRARAGMGVLRIPALGAMACAGGVLFYGYVAHRYTAEFLPGLVVLAAVGLVVAGRWTPRWSPRRRVLATGGFTLLALFSVLANTAVGVSAARELSRGESLERLMEVRLDVGRWTGSAVADYVQVGDDLDVVPPTDTLRIVGDCEGVYLSSGDLYEPWIPVDVRGVTVTVTVTGIGEAGRIPLVEFDGAVHRAVELDHDGFGNYRLLVAGGGSDTTSDWYLLEPGTSLSFTVVPQRERLSYLIDAPAYLFTEVPMSDWDRQWVGVPSRMAIDTMPRDEQARRGALVDAAWTPVSTFCERLRDVADG